MHLYASGPILSRVISRFAGGEHLPFFAARFLIFDLGGFSSPQMTDGFMILQNVLYLIGKIRVDFRQPFGQILMHRAL